MLVYPRVCLLPFKSDYSTTIARNLFNQLNNSNLFEMKTIGESVFFFKTMINTSNHAVG